ncbi:uncharacterized protein ARMOST_11963 [Armillaria ostoyae]|uniref:Uncharacterized protein n=1 Tax=Armillaria ostoyae TaxID=47428 RepID=A0A284RIR3_ARMOS|nr:uncharacterized protein ARMOST_11963 [Armillaria ostoyae]
MTPLVFPLLLKCDTTRMPISCCRERLIQISSTKFIGPGKANNGRCHQLRRRPHVSVQLSLFGCPIFIALDLSVSQIVPASQPKIKTTRSIPFLLS